MQMDDPHKIMDSLRSHYSQVNAIAAAHAQRQLFDLKCTDPNKLQDHLDKLLALREKIVEYGTAVPDDVFVGCIILSVPHAYRPIIRASEIAIEALNSSKETPTFKLKPDLLIARLRAEAQIRAVAYESSRTARGREANVADFSGGRRHTRGKRTSGPNASQSEVTCFNCQGKGHTQNKCTSPRRSRPRGSANNVVKSSQSGSDSQSQDDSLNPKPTATRSEATIQSGSIVGVDEGQSVVVINPSEYALISSKSQGEVVIYDFGASSHMTPYRHKFIEFKPIPPHQILTVNAGTFTVTGIGKIKVLVPNGKSSSSILLKNVLYAPSMRHTLVSIKCIEDARCRITFERGYCSIYNPAGERVAIIPRANYLYRASNAIDLTETKVTLQ